MCVLIFSAMSVWNISHSKKKSVRQYHKWTYAFMYSTCYSCQILIKLESSQQVFEKYFCVKLEQSYSMWTDEKTDRHAVANSHFQQLCDWA